MVGVGCGDDPEDLDASTESTGAEPTTSTTAPPAITSTTDLPDPGDGSPASTTTFGGGSSGGVEDTVFGMSDDMPLVADIPDIKQGLLGPNTWVWIQQVTPISGRAELEGQAWFYVQDPTFGEHMGLRVRLAAGDAAPSPERAVDLEGWVVTDEQGWLLELDWAAEGGAALPGTYPPNAQTRAAYEAWRKARAK